MSVELASAYVSIIPSTRGIAGQLQKEFGDPLEAQGERSGNTLADRFSGAAATGLKAAGVGALAAFSGSLMAGFGRLRAIDDARFKLQGLGHDADTVDTIMENALGSVLGTSFGLGDAATIAAGAVAAGIKPGSELERILSLTGDAASIAGTSLDEMGAIFNVVASKNRLSMMEVNRLAQRGIPVMQWLAEEYGVTAEEASDMVSSGEVDFATFAKVIEDNIGGAALAAGGSFRGAFANMGAAMGRFGAAILGPAFARAPEVFANITASVDRLTDRVEPLGEFIVRNSKAFGIAAGIIGAAFIPVFIQVIVGWATSTAAAVAGAAAQLAASWRTVGGWVVMGVQSLIHAAKMAAAWVIAMGPVGWVIAAVVALVALIVANWETVVEWTTKAWNWVVDKVVGAWKTVTGNVKAGVDRVVSFVSDLRAKAVQIVTALVTAYISMWANLLSRVVGFATSLRDGVVGFITGMRDRVVAIGSAVLNFYVTTFTSLRDRVVGIATAIRDRVVGFFQGLRDRAVEAVAGLLSRAITNITNLQTRMVETATGIRDRVVEAFTALRDKAIEMIAALVTRVTNIRSDVLGALSGAGQWLVSVGQDVIRGLIRGIGNMGGAIRDAASNAASNLLSSFKGALGISSPSKVMATIGGQIMAGLANGIASSADVVMAQVVKVVKALQEAGEWSAVTEKAVHQWHVSMTVARGVLEGLDHALAGNRKELQATVVSMVKGLQSIGKWTAGTEKAVHRWNVAMAAGAVQLGKLDDKIKDATDRLDGLRKAATDYAASVGDKLRGAIDFGADAPDTAKGIISSFQDQLKAAKAFNKAMTALINKGLHEDLVRQIAEQGPAAMAQAQALAGASAKEIGELNDLQNALDKQATSVGNKAANDFYGAGIDAAKGLVEGLKSQRGALAKEMERLSEALVASLKKALGIKSPSKVFDRLGVQTGEGMAEGIVRSSKLVTASVRDLARLAESEASFALATPGVAGGVRTGRPMAWSPPGGAGAAQRPIDLTLDLGEGIRQRLRIEMIDHDRARAVLAEGLR